MMTVEGLTVAYRLSNRLETLRKFRDTSKCRAHLLSAPEYNSNITFNLSEREVMDLLDGIENWIVNQLRDLGVET